MWICLNDAFFSIVASEREPALLNVRARRAGDIERHFSNAEVVQLPNTDYAYRAFLRRGKVAAFLVRHIADLHYANFKISVGDPELQKAYSEVWRTMRTLQH
jgi:hypothetical protein